MRGSGDQARMFYEAARDLATRIEAGHEMEVLTDRLNQLTTDTVQ